MHLRRTTCPDDAAPFGSRRGAGRASDSEAPLARLRGRDALDPGRKIADAPDRCDRSVLADAELVDGSVVPVSV